MERFHASPELGRLAKWLRILGYDTLYSPCGNRKEEREEDAGRIYLTRRRTGVAEGALAQQRIVLQADRVEAQLEELLETLGMDPDPARFLTRCLRCNVPLMEIDSAEVSDLVPDFIQERQRRFHHCPGCGKLYWPGTHPERMRSRFRKHSPGRRP